MLALFNFGGGEISVLLLGLLLVVFWVRMLISAVQNKGLSDVERICWVLAIVCAQFLGALVYYFVGHPKRKVPLATG